MHVRSVRRRSRDSRGQGMYVVHTRGGRREVAQNPRSIELTFFLTILGWLQIGHEGRKSACPEKFTAVRTSPLGARRSWSYTLPGNCGDARAHAHSAPDSSPGNKRNSDGPCRPASLDRWRPLPICGVAPIPGRTGRRAFLHLGTGPSNSSDRTIPLPAQSLVSRARKVSELAAMHCAICGRR
jgi:hypothetical protein